MFKKYDGELLLAPCPAVLVSAKYGEIENVLTISWAGIASSHPEYVTISINPKRFSHNIILNSRKFCIGIPSFDLLDSVDFCGNNSGSNIDKFSACGFTKSYIADYILINECKMHLLCDVVNVIELGSHHLFIAKVIQKYIRTDIEGNLQQILNPIAYFRPFYYGLAENNSGIYGFTNKQKG